MANDGVGYKKPPKHTQFKPGQSGNPKGRPKGCKNLNTILNALLSRKVSMTENGQYRNVPVIEAIGMRLVQKALAGDLKAIQHLLHWRSEQEGEQQVNGPTTFTLQFPDSPSELKLAHLTDRELVVLHNLTQKSLDPQFIPEPRYEELRYLTDEEIEQKLFEAAEKFKQNLNKDSTSA